MFYSGCSVFRRMNVLVLIWDIMKQIAFFRNRTIHVLIDPPKNLVDPLLQPKSQWSVQILLLITMNYGDYNEPLTFIFGFYYMTLVANNVYKEK